MKKIKAAFIKTFKQPRKKGKMVESKKTQLEVGGKIVEVETGKYATSATSSVTIK